MFNLYANAVGNNAVTPVDASPYPVGPGLPTPPAPGTDCKTLSTLPGWTVNTPCFETFTASPTALASEWILSARVDQKLGANDNLFLRWRADHGTQPTAIDPISSNFDAISQQPAYDWQANWTHTISATMTNAFTAALSHYDAIFSQSQPLASNTFPYGVLYADAQVPLTGFNGMYSFPQGRNVTQYQFIDDFTWTHGKHNLKFGENFRRYDVNDHNFFFNYPGVYFGYGQTLQNYADGFAFQYRQTDNAATNVPVALWGIGAYAQDEWNVKSNLKLTFGLRLEHNSNPVCQTNCFADFVSNFTNIPSYLAGTGAGDVPYKPGHRDGLAPGVSFDRQD